MTHRHDRKSNKPEHAEPRNGASKWVQPEEIGLDAEGLARAYSLLDAYAGAGRLPGLVALVGGSAGMLAPYASGWAALQPKQLPIRPDTLFDIASVTKVVATTTAVLQLLEAGVWRLDDPVRLFWPGFEHDVTLRHLLTHTSGLPAWRPLYATGTGKAHYRYLLERLPLEVEPGSKVIYSCLGYLILGLLVEEVTGRSLDVYCADQIFAPLGMQETLFNPPPELHDRCAATELRSGASAPVQGTVHDENARGLGGVAGNAGLFSTAYDLGRFCQSLLLGGQLEGKRILAERTVAVAIENHTPHLNAARGLGWLLHGGHQGSPGGDLFSPRSFGHTGFTGTSIWIDPEMQIFCVLLTNRVHPSRENHHHLRLRPLFHNAIAAAFRALP